MIRDEEAKEKLIRTAFELLKDPDRQQQLKTNIKKMAISDAAERIADQILELTN